MVSHIKDGAYPKVRQAQILPSIQRGIHVTTSFEIDFHKGN
jgi:hypothetical protein